jgi:two-component system NtrC family sensor kinase
MSALRDGWRTPLPTVSERPLGFGARWKTPIRPADGRAVKQIPGVLMPSSLGFRMDRTRTDLLAGAIPDLVNVGVFVVDADMRVLNWNRFMEVHSRCDRDEVVGRALFDTFPDLPVKWLTRKFDSVFLLGTHAFSSWEHRPYLFRFEHTRPITGGPDAMRQNCTFIPIETDGKVAAVCVTISDVTDICVAYQELQKRQQAVADALTQLTIRNSELSEVNGKLAQAHQQLVQSEKLAAIGQLAAGVAHEINNPVGFVLSNFNTLDQYMNELFGVLSAYERAEGDVSEEVRCRLQACRASADLPYLREDAPLLLRESKEGLIRVRDIVVDLRDFSRVDSAHTRELIDLHRCIESTLNIVNNEVKYNADLVRCYGEIPSVWCVASQINQVVMNLVVNAAHACSHLPDGARGTIQVRTGCCDPERTAVWFEIKDTGCGISQENLARVFEPFFTTKPVGQGTGLGLSVTYGIVQAHRGNIHVDSEPGRGTTFRITLPTGTRSGEITQTLTTDSPESGAAERSRLLH